jgi:hypothetical protein
MDSNASKQREQSYRESPVFGLGPLCDFCSSINFKFDGTYENVMGIEPENRGGSNLARDCPLCGPSIEKCQNDMQGRQKYTISIETDKNLLCVGCAICEFTYELYHTKGKTKIN